MSSITHLRNLLFQFADDILLLLLPFVCSFDVRLRIVQARRERALALF
jgi:hypothetical protein